MKHISTVPFYRPPLAETLTVSFSACLCERRDILFTALFLLQTFLLLFLVDVQFSSKRTGPELVVVFFAGLRGKEAELPAHQYAGRTPLLSCLTYT